MRAAGATVDEVRTFALLAIADQLKAYNEIAVVQILVNRGLATAQTPTNEDLIRVRQHLWAVLGWDEYRGTDMDP